jgi:hypothetical protein
VDDTDAAEFAYDDFSELAEDTAEALLTLPANVDESIVGLDVINVLTTSTHFL